MSKYSKHNVNTRLGIYISIRYQPVGMKKPWVCLKYFCNLVLFLYTKPKMQK